MSRLDRYLADGTRLFRIVDIDSNRSRALVEDAMYPDRPPQWWTFSDLKRQGFRPVRRSSAQSARTNES